MVVPIDVNFLCLSFLWAWNAHACMRMLRQIVSSQILPGSESGIVEKSLTAAMFSLQVSCFLRPGVK